MNDPFVHEQSKKFASRMLGEKDETRIDLAFLLAYGRPPSDDEKEQSADFIARTTQRLRDAGVPADQCRVRAWEGFARVLFMSNEFVFVN
jgi:hypothetical protein